MNVFDAILMSPVAVRLLAFVLEFLLTLPGATKDNVGRAIEMARVHKGFTRRVKADGLSTSTIDHLDGTLPSDADPIARDIKSFAQRIANPQVPDAEKNYLHFLISFCADESAIRALKDYCATLHNTKSTLLGNDPTYHNMWDLFFELVCWEVFEMLQMNSGFGAYTYDAVYFLLVAFCHFMNLTPCALWHEHQVAEGSPVSPTYEMYIRVFATQVAIAYKYASLPARASTGKAGGASRSAHASAGKAGGASRPAHTSVGKLGGASARAGGASPRPAPAGKSHRAGGASRSDTPCRYFDIETQSGCNREKCSFLHPARSASVAKPASEPVAESAPEPAPEPAKAGEDCFGENPDID